MQQLGGHVTLVDLGKNLTHVTAVIPAFIHVSNWFQKLEGNLAKP